MRLSRKPRHWIALLLAIATTIVCAISFAEFSGNPAPHWREMALRVGLPLTLLAIFSNLVADRRNRRDDS